VTRRLRDLAACLGLAAGLDLAAQPPAEIHGMSDAFGAPGVALAWAVLRDAGGSDATVVIRVAAERGRYSAVAVTGIDPFTRAARTVLDATPINDSVDVAVARAQFADFPRTEVRLFASESAARAGTPELLVYYLGVPDTTPEFTARPALERYLAERIARTRTPPAGKPP
jgi:hypothetical protein